MNNSQTSFLNCNPIGRPCCLGIQAQCMIATQDACQFMGGKYHPEATLCAQVRGGCEGVWGRGGGTEGRMGGGRGRRK